MRTLRAFPLFTALVLFLLGVVSVSALSAISHSASRRASAPLTVSAKARPAEKITATATQEKAEADQHLAEAALKTLANRYRHLEGVSVRIGDTPKGEEAVAYYTAGEILIDRAHTVDIETILAHEVWHVIDYRDNGRLDWGENLPPENSSDYL